MISPLGGAGWSSAVEADVTGRLAESVSVPEVAMASSTRASRESWILVGTIEVGRLARSEMGGVAGWHVPTLGLENRSATPTFRPMF